ncbi:hypothetical protein G6F31_012628 [Rhizopus arrhizus]|nr:hypothetical protein G6F31_012628 [Rhizopus arrhizus]
MAAEDALDAAGAGALEHVDGGDQGAAGGQHRVQDQRIALFQATGQALEVGHRLQGFLITLQADHADAGGRDQRQHAAEHAQAGTQDRHHGDLGAGDALHGDRAGPAGQGVRLGVQVGGGLVGQQRAQLIGQFAEILGAECGVAHQADLVLHQRVAHFDDLHGREGEKERGRHFAGSVGRTQTRASSNVQIHVMAMQPCGHTTPLAVAITLTLAMGAVAPLQAAGQQAVAATGAVAADAVDLDRIEVRAQLESQIRAVDLKRSSDAIEDAVSSDALGQYPDKNVAESLQRLPGVSVTRDQGEGRFVVIRGLDANLNSVSVEGIAIGTPEDSSRAAPLDVIPSDSTERLRVVKAPPPDMPGEAIGGAVLVESASAFDRDGRSLRAKIEGSHQQLSGETSPKAAFNYSEVFNDTFGVALGVNYQKRKFESDNTEVEYDGEDDAAPGDVTAINLQHRKYEIERKRIGANLNLDWRPNEDSKYYLRTLYSQFDDAETRQRVIFNFDDAKMVKTGTDQYRLDGMPKDSIDKRMRYRTKKENTFAASLGGENKLTNAVVDYKVGYTRTEERVNDEMEARFKLNGKAFNGTLDQRSRLPSYSFDNPQWLDNGNYAFDRFVLSPKQHQDRPAGPLARPRRQR